MTYEDFRKKLENNLNEHEAFLKAWKEVKRVSKKDGSDFANFGRNFEHADVYTPNWSDYDRIKVNTRCNYHWIEDEIDLVREAENENIPGERTFEYYGKKKYHLNVDETFEAIENRIRYYEAEIENDKIQVAHAESIYNLTMNTINALYNEALKEIENAGFTPTCFIDTPSIIYQIEEVIRGISMPCIRTKEEDLKVAYRR